MGITLFTTSNCNYCEQLKRWFAEKNIAIQVFNIEKNSELKDFLVKNVGCLSVPVTQVGREFILGYDIPGIEKALSNNV